MELVTGNNSSDLNFEYLGKFGAVIQPNLKEKVKRTRGIELSERDLKICEFISEMKFARSVDIFEKYFKRTRLNEDAKSESWAKKRLLQLEQAGYLRSEYSHLNSERYYTATLKAYHALTIQNPISNVSKPASAIDYRTIAHDRLLVGLRIKFEKDLGVTEWISDRQLRIKSASEFGLSSTNIPDGIYRLPNGERVAFELEITQKSKKRYRDKIQEYVQLIRDRRQSPDMFVKVYFLCLREVVFKAIKEESLMYGNLIRVDFQGAVSDLVGTR